MLRINQLRIKVNHTDEQLKNKVADFLKIPFKEIEKIEIVRQSIDARKKPDVLYSYSLNVAVKYEDKVLKKWKGKDNLVSKADIVKYSFPKSGDKKCENPIVVVGMGPAGLFCAYYLVSHGYKVILLERGKSVEQRVKDVEDFWKTGVLKTESNVQFGEGGAGTFSDGKLNTLIKDKDGKIAEVLNTFVRFGAKKSIRYEAKPHIGTDVLIDVVRNIRNEIVRLGAEVHFNSKVTDLIIKNGKLQGVKVNNEKIISCKLAVLAIGHSARDTFTMLYQKNIPMEAKSFAVGLRVEHPQEMINESQYGMKKPHCLGAAPYKLTAKAENGKAVYTFCMCPGGYVVNASSEENSLAVNGMSYSKRDGENANSAVIVAVNPQDFSSTHPLAGIEFQRELEKRAYKVGKGKIPVQRFSDFERNVKGTLSVSDTYDRMDTKLLTPQCKGSFLMANVDEIMPKALNEAFIDGMHQFGEQIKGFDRGDVLLSGVESRTSSPVRIIRNDKLQTSIEGIYPCGEGAGYAGGITSAAMDGIRIAEQIAMEFSPYQP